MVTTPSDRPPSKIPTVDVWAQRSGRLLWPGAGKAGHGRQCDEHPDRNVAERDRGGGGGVEETDDDAGDDVEFGRVLPADEGAFDSQQLYCGRSDNHDDCETSPSAGTVGSPSSVEVSLSSDNLTIRHRPGIL